MGETPTPKSLNPDEARQAVASLDGYSYQIWRTVLEWVTLDESEFIDLEGNEDVDRLRPGSAETIQVKNSAAGLTLRSADVLKAIANFRAALERNPGINLRMRFLSTAGMTVETGRPFGTRGGLAVWEAVRKRTNPSTDEADAELIRGFLLGVSNLDAALKTWLSATSASELIERLVSRIHWDLSAEGTASVQQLIDNALIALGEKYGVLPSDSVKVRSRLLEEALTKATDKSNRRLSRVDLLRLFESEATLMVSKGALAVMVSQQAANTIAGFAPSVISPTSAASFASVRRTQNVVASTALNRETEVGEVGALARNCGVVYVSGSTGMGKTTLMQIVVSTLPVSPMWLDLRGLSQQAPAVIRHLAAWLLIEKATRYVVLDDLDLSGDSRPLQAAIGELHGAVAALGGSLYMTGATPLPNDFAQRLDRQGFAYQVPPLSEEQIAELLRLNGCGSAGRPALAKFIWLHSGGHPQLAHGRVIALKERAFKVATEEYLSVPPDVTQHRHQAQAIIASLPSSDRELLYRLSLTNGRFRRGTAMTVASAEPAIPEPGNAFQRLVGPWIEEVGPDRFRISPLARTLGSDVHGAEWTARVHSTLGWAYLVKSIGPDECSSILFHGFMGRDEALVLKMCGTLITSDSADRVELVGWLRWFLLVDPDAGPNPLASTPASVFMIRQAQFALAAKGDDAERSLHIAAALNAASALKPDAEEPQKMARVVALGSMLTAITVPFAPAMVVAMVTELASLTSQLPFVDGIWKGVAKEGYPTTLEGDFDPAWMLAVSIHGRVKTPADLLSLFQELRRLDPAIRERLLKPLASDASLSGYLIDAVWLAEWKSKEPRWSALSGVLNECYVLAREWGAKGLAAAIASVLVRITNENLGQHHEAKAIGELFIGEVGNEPRLIDSVADASDWMGQHGEALKLRMAVLEGWRPKVSDTIGPIIGWRKAAISAIKTGAWGTASDLLQEAARMAPAERLSLKIGLLADAGYAAIQSGAPERGLRLLMDAVRQLRTLPNTPDEPAAFRVHKLVGHISTVLAKKGHAESLGRDEVPPAACSDFDVPKELLELPRTPVDYSMLNLCQYGIANGVPYSRLKSELVLLSESSYVTVRYIAATTALDGLILERTPKDVPDVAFELCRLLAYQLQRREGGEPNIWDQSEIPKDLVLEVNPTIIQGASLSALLVDIAATNVYALPRDWLVAPPKAGYPSELGPWMNFLLSLESRSVGDRAQAVNASRTPQETVALELSIATDNDASPELKLRAHVHLFHALKNRTLFPVVEASLARLVRSEWGRIAQQGFLLRSPRTSGPLLTAACAPGPDTAERVAEILRTAADAIGTALPEWVHKLLKPATEAPRAG